jgi:heme/copper-type cytochrome/quinol oxidase subunit 3
MQETALAPPHDAYDAQGTATGVTNAKLAMWLFLSSECLLFGAFISAYLLYKGRTHGVKASQVFDIPFTSTTSFILLMSSLTMVLALAAIQRGDYRRFRVWLFATALFGLTFIGGQVYEFTTFFREHHLALHTNLLGTTFFVLTGLHGVHVTAGIIWLLSLFGLSTQGRLAAEDSEKVEIAGLYWHFVDIVWIVIFTVVYLVPK